MNLLKLQHAQVVLKQIPGSSYFGVRGTNSIYNPRVNKNQSSLSHMWVQNGSEDDLNAIVVGWQVSFNISFLKFISICSGSLKNPKKKNYTSKLIVFSSLKFKFIMRNKQTPLFLFVPLKLFSILQGSK